MGVMEGLGTAHSDVVGIVTALQAGLNERHMALPSIRDFEQMGFASQHIEAAYAPDSPPAGIFGVGAVNLQETLRPAVFVMVEMMTAPVELAAAQPVAATPAQRMVAKYATIPPDLVVLGLPPIRNYCAVASGGSIVVGSENSTLGVPVALAAGQAGYLTAGHGARMVNDQVLACNTTPIGTIIFSSCRELAAGRSPVADVAVIGLDPSTVEVPSGAPSVTRADSPPTNVLVSSRSRGALRRGRVWGLAPELSIDSYAAWGEVILCSPISAPGDSGGAVIRDDDTSACVGQVVGGAEGYMTVVQQLQYQLDAAGVTLRGRQT